MWEGQLGITKWSSISPIVYLKEKLISFIFSPILLFIGLFVDSSDEDPAASACPLFQDAEEEVQSMELEPEDPYYEVKREKVVRKVKGTLSVLIYHW